MRFLVLVVLGFWGAEAHAGALREGDLLFQTSRSSQSKAIAVATKSKFTHVGIFTLREGKAYVLEAVQPVKLTPLDEWQRRGLKGKVTVRRLADTGPLTTEVLGKMREVAQGFIGHDYDTAFGWDDDKLYCSELVYKVYDRGAGIQLGSLQKLRDFDLKSSEVKKKLRERYGEQVPLDMEVISPQAIFDDPRLVTIEDG
ncbi:MAG: YiiX family permuted papain-like enzyme [Myxococcota bacterium]|nr:YiiX family permuted papain-like enzyme [Myxococcota bacterium]